MAKMIDLDDVLNSLHNQMGHRVNPGGTDEDLKRYIQESFDYCWRYYKWTFSLKTADIAADGLLPEDYDHEGWHQFDGVDEVNIEDTIVSGNEGSAVVWDSAQERYKLDPASTATLVYQYLPPTLTSDTEAPFPSAQTVALGATVFAKQGENPTRADIQQEWDLLHSHLDRLVGRADQNRLRTIRNRHDVTGTFTGNVS